MTTELDTALARLTDMQKDVIPNSDAVPVAFYAQEAAPYWKNTVTGFSVELESETLQIVTWQITMTLVLAATTEGFEQEAERLIHAYAPLVLRYFGQRRQLKRTSADSAVPYLHPRGSFITAGKADYGSQQSGIGQSMFAVDFNIEVPLWQDTDQVIF